MESVDLSPSLEDGLLLLGKVDGHGAILSLSQVNGVDMNRSEKYGGQKQVNKAKDGPLYSHCLSQEIGLE